MRGRRSKVKIKFVDELDGGIIASRRPYSWETLESFAPGATVVVGDEEWKVVETERKTQLGSRNTKALRVRLRPTENLAFGEEVYFSPTVWGTLPNLEDRPASGDEFLVVEDQWRQIEFVSEEQLGEVDEVLSGVQLARENVTDYGGWREQYVRSGPANPITQELKLEKLRLALNSEFGVAGITYPGAPSPIKGGFCLLVEDDLPLYGLAAEGEVRVLMVETFPESSPKAETVDRLRVFAREFGLHLVNWSEGLRVSPEDSRFGSLLPSYRVDR